MDRTVPRRWRMYLIAVLIGLGGALFAPTQPAQAECSITTPWDCLPGDGSGTDLDCKTAPPASRPDSGLAGWFLREPKDAPVGDPYAKDAIVSKYDVYGYAGLDFATYDLGCGDAARDPAAVTTNTIANLFYAPALWLVAVDNSLREYAYQPGSMWGWTNDLVQRASDALRDRIFTVWGAFVLAIVGVWLMWGARQGNMSHAVTTAGWAVLVMALVSAVAMWPLKAAHSADTVLTSALGQVNGALSATDNPEDKRSPAVRASGVMTETVLYNQWLRGTLGSSDSDVAKKYGPDLYRARAISWEDSKKMRESSTKREAVFRQKAALWDSTAAKIKAEDPEAYEYLVGRKGTERIGASVLALVSAVVVTPFDIMSSLLVLIAFLIIRLAVVFLPAIGTVGILMPASGPLRGLLRTVAAALINCVIFGAGSAVFLLGVSIITGTGSLAGWQQVLLIWLTGLILWLILRPYRRLTNLTGVDPLNSMAGGIGRMHQRVFGDLRSMAVTGVGAYAGSNEALEAQERRLGVRPGGESARPETWSRAGGLSAPSRPVVQPVGGGPGDASTPVPLNPALPGRTEPAMPAPAEAPYRQRQPSHDVGVPVPAGVRPARAESAGSETAYPIYRPEASTPRPVSSTPAPVARSAATSSTTTSGGEAPRRRPEDFTRA